MQRLFALLVALSLAACMAPATRTPVYLVGTLYQKHRDVPAYDVSQLRRIITAIDPEVLVLDVTPTELAERKVWPGKIEYPEAVFPLLRPHHRVYAGEPAEPLFTEISGTTTAAHRTFAATRTAESAALENFSAAIYAGLYHHWLSPARVNDDITERVLAGKRALQESLIGPVVRDGQERWNRHIADVVRRAAGENPGKRTLVLVGIENRYVLRRMLRDAPEIELIDMERWLAARSGAAAMLTP